MRELEDQMEEFNRKRRKEMDDKDTAERRNEVPLSCVWTLQEVIRK